MGNLDLIAFGIVLFTVVFVLRISKIKNRIIEKILDWFPAILFAYVIPAGFTHLFGWDLSSVYLHNLSRNWIIPVTILAVMSALPFRQLAIVGIRPLVLFFIGSAIIATLPIILVLLISIVDPSSSDLFIGQGFWKGLVPIVGGWIGGSTSQLILKELAQTPESLFLSVLVLDNILVNIWTILMFQFIKKGEVLNVIFGIKDPIPDQSEVTLNKGGRKIFPLITILIFTGIVVIIFFLNISFLSMVVSLSIIGLVLGNFIKVWNTRFSLQLGGICIILVMAILGLRLDFSNLSLPMIFIFLVVIWLILHFVGMLICAKILKLNLVWVPIASMANLGGISTAPAVTAAYRKDLMPHAILLAILSMVTGTGWGMLTIYLFEQIN
ncbi:DUF819 family protein [Algoriphagus sp. SE2]|uniref:DUF819 family protein n=1 Tax=Algoriphagus sp. SE2 TaxID=3141536 RepID=UPI0031CD1DFC